MFIEHSENITDFVKKRYRKEEILTAFTHQTYQTDAQFLDDRNYCLTSKYNVEVLLALTNSTNTSVTNK